MARGWPATVPGEGFATVEPVFGNLRYNKGLHVREAAGEVGHQGRHARNIFCSACTRLTEDRLLNGLGCRQIEHDEVGFTSGIGGRARSDCASILRCLDLRGQDVESAHRISERHQPLDHGQTHESDANVTDGGKLFAHGMA